MRKFKIAAGAGGGIGIEVLFFSLQGLGISLPALVWWTGVALGGVLILGSLAALFWPRPKGGASPPEQPRPPRRRIFNVRGEPGLIRADIEDEQPSGITYEGGQTTEASMTSTSPADLLSDIDLSTGDEVIIRASVAGLPRRLLWLPERAKTGIRWLARHIGDAER